MPLERGGEQGCAFRAKLGDNLGIDDALSSRPLGTRPGGRRMSVTVVTRYKAKSGKGMALLAAMSKPVELIRSKTECGSAEVFISAEITERVLLLEEWISAEAYEQCVGELEGEDLAEVKPLLEAAPTTVRYSAAE